MKNPKASPVLFFAAFILVFGSTTAFNITKLLEKTPEFSTLNDYLIKTKLNDEINRRQTITVLVVDNSAISSLSGKPLDLVKKILSVHVVLDYYDVEKITKLVISNKTATLTTLFQASGLANGQQGFLDTSLVNEGEIAFGSAVDGGRALRSKLVKSVAAQPYNISVLQITAPVQIPGIESSSAPPVQAPKKSPPTAPAPSKSKPQAPAPSKTKPEAPAPSEEGPDAPATAAPAADSPVSDSPVSSAPKSESAADEANAPAPKTSRGSRRGMGIGAGVVMAALVAWF